MVPIRFKRCVFRYKRPNLSEKKLANAAKALERERQSWGLFSETVELPSPEQRLIDMNNTSNQLIEFLQMKGVLPKPQVDPNGDMHFDKER